MLRYLVFFLLISTTSFSQKLEQSDSIENEKPSFIIQPDRIEFEINNQSHNYEIIPADEHGLMVLSETINRTKEGFEWSFNMLDTALNVVWTRNYAIPYGSTFLGYDYNEGGFYVLFGKAQYKLEEMRVLRLDMYQGDTTSYEVNTVFPIQLNTFEVIGSSVLFGGYANLRPVVMLFDMNTQKPKVLPGFYNTNSEIIDIRTDDDSRTFSVIMSEKTYKKQVTASIKTFDSRGDLLQTKLLETDYDKSLIDAVSTNFSGGMQYVAGTFARKKTEYSRGLYLARLQNGHQELIRYHSYADLTNFFSFMKKKREKRMKSKIEKKKVQGKKIKLNYRLMVHGIIQRDDEYILIGEAYFPKYSSTNSSYYSSQNSYDNRNSWVNPNFVGYNYTHAVVVGFDRQGNILWDNSFEINDVLSRYLKEFVKVSVENDRIILLYMHENVIQTKIIKDSEILEGKNSDPIALTYKSDKVKDNDYYIEGLENWYDDKFYAYGVQNIRNQGDKNVRLNRKVFYVNKIEYR